MERQIKENEILAAGFQSCGVGGPYYKRATLNGVPVLYELDYNRRTDNYSLKRYKGELWIKHRFAPAIYTVRTIDELKQMVN